MDSPRARALAGIAALALAVVLFVVLRGGDDEDSSTTSTTATTTTVAETTTSTGGGDGDQTDQTSTTTDDGGGQADVATIVIKDGQPVGGVAELSFTEGEDIRFKIESDVTDEVHFHGYEVAMEVEAGSSVTFDVPATISGVFEVELEERVVPIAEITVSPS